MRAIVHDRYGGPEVLHLAEVRKPAPRAGEVLVRVIATTVNRTDCGFRRGVPRFVRLFSGVVRPKHRILGTEVAGEVEAVGDGVTRFRVGDRVCGLLESHFGAHAEYVCVPEDAPLVAPPRGFSPAEAAAIWDGPWLGLACVRCAGVHRGVDLLVYGASGSIGSSIVQLAKHFGARVTAVCGANAMDLVRSLGADEVVNYEATDFTKLGARFDAMIDAVGKTRYRACKGLLREGAPFVSTDLGPGWEIPRLHAWTKVFGKHRVVLGIPDTKRVRRDVELLRDIAEAGGLRAILDRTYPLEEMQTAVRYVETETKVGSVVIRVGDARGWAGDERA